VGRRDSEITTTEFPLRKKGENLGFGKKTRGLRRFGSRLEEGERGATAVPSRKKPKRAKLKRGTHPPFLMVDNGSPG